MDEAGVVLARLDSADAEDVGPLIQAVAGTDALGLVRFGLGPEAGVDAAVEHLHLAGGNAEERDNVGLGCRRVGQHQIGAGDGARHDPLQVAAQLGHESVGVAHEREVVDGEESARAAADGREDEVGGVEDVEGAGDSLDRDGQA